ncbi:MAG: HD domain-containing protein [Chloroflexi bacterium]|nr:HD domain-containing protein [Chloroflexota bacterium]
MEPHTRIEKIAGFVRQRLYQVAASRAGETYIDPEYRWNHTLRVTQYGRQIASAEGANLELTTAGCLLHDVAWFDTPGEAESREHGRLGARLARPLLQELGYAPEEAGNICFSIAAHVDDRADFEHPVTLESKIVSDADNIDRFGAYRILQRYERQVRDWQGLTGAVAERLTTLRKYRHDQIMGTPTGNELFNRQLDFQIAFFERLLAERDLTRPVEE